MIRNALLTRLNHCTTTSRYAQMLYLVLRADNTVWQPNLGFFFFFFFFVFLLISINREFTLDFPFFSSGINRGLGGVVWAWNILGLAWLFQHPGVPAGKAWCGCVWQLVAGGLFFCCSWR